MDSKNLVSSLEKYFFQILSKGWLRTILFLSLIFFVCFSSFSKTLDFYFWRDDGKVLWAAKYIPNEIFNFSSDAISRAKIGALILDYLFIKILGFNSYNWQIFGLALKVVNSFLLYFLIKQLFKSEKVAIFSSLFYAAFVGGIEVYTWVRGIGIMITFSLASFTLYISSFYTKEKFKFVLSIFFAFLVLFIDSLKGLPFICLILFWEVLMLVAKDSKINIKYSLSRIFIFSSSLFVIFRILFSLASKTNTTTQVTSAPQWIMSAIRQNNYFNFVSSLGNLLRVPFLPIYEAAGLPHSDSISVFLGVLFIVFVVLFSLFFVLKRKRDLIPYLLVFYWIILYYLPSWFYEPGLMVASSHRYLAFSAVLVPVIWASLVNKFRKNEVQIACFLIIIFLNFLYSNSVSQNDYKLRGSEIVIPLWQQMANDVPFGKESSMLSVSGDPNLLLHVFNWSDIYPYASLREIGSTNKLPIFVDSLKASKIICNPNEEVTNTITNTFEAVGNRFTLDNSFAWEVDSNGRMNDVTNEFRINTAWQAPCLWKDRNIIFTNGLVLLKTTSVPLYSKEESSFSELLKFNKSVKDTYVVGTIYNKNNQFLGTKSQFIDGNGNAVLDFEKISTPIKNIDKLLIGVCQLNCSEVTNNISISIN